MERRDVIGAAAMGAVVGVSGCLGGLASNSSIAQTLSVSVSQEHVGGRYPTFITIVRKTSTGADDPVSFADLSPQAQQEFAWAVADRWYRSYADPALGDELRSQLRDPISYKNSRFEYSGRVIDMDSRYEEGWSDPVSLDAQVTDGALDLTLSNVSDSPVRLSATSPYFGVLLAQNGTETAILDHDAYSSNEAIVVEDALVYTDYDVWFENDPETVLEPSDSIASTYSIPDPVTTGWTVRVDVEYETEGTWGGLWDLTFSTDG